MLRAGVYLGGALDLLELNRYTDALEYAQLACEYFEEAVNPVFVLESRIMVGHLLVYLNRLPEARTLLLSCLHDAVARGFRRHGRRCPASGPDPDRG